MTTKENCVEGGKEKYKKEINNKYKRIFLSKNGKEKKKITKRMTFSFDSSM